MTVYVHIVWFHMYLSYYDNTWHMFTMENPSRYLHSMYHVTKQ